jgi:SAM-dependent methyltransferase
MPALQRNGPASEGACSSGTVASTLLLRAFGRPRGLLGWLGGRVMARTNRDASRWVVDLLGIGPGTRVLEVGCGPGVGLTEALARGAALVCGVDPSEVMLNQARARNAAALAERRVELRLASADSLPFDESSFDVAFAVNSVQVWPDPVAGLKEVRRCLRPGGRVALAFTSYAGPLPHDPAALLEDAEFDDSHLLERKRVRCTTARRPPDVDRAVAPSSGAP